MTGASPSRTENSPRRLWLTLVAMTLASSVILVDQTAVPMAIAEIMDDLNGPLAIGQWVLTANILPLAAFLVLGGRLGDGFGLSRSFLAGAVVFTVGTTAAGLAPNVPSLLTARDFIDAHGESFRVAFVASAIIALLGAVASWLLVRMVPVLIGPVFGRRSR